MYTDNITFKIDMFGTHIHELYQGHKQGIAGLRGGFPWPPEDQHPHSSPNDGSVQCNVH